MNARSLTTACVLSTLLLPIGCKPHRKTTSSPKSADYANKLRPIVASQHIQVMHWPNFQDFEPLVQTFYDDRNYEVAWLDDNHRPTRQATAFIEAFQHSPEKGLLPADYDADLWSARVQNLLHASDDDIAQFDAVMTVCVMRYISDLRIGRVNPTQFNFDIDAQQKKYNLPEFVSDNAVDADDVPKLIASVEPDSDQYRKTEQALVHYLQLAHQQAANPEPLPSVATPITTGGRYPAADALAARLQLEGDMQGAPVETPDSETAKPLGGPSPETPDANATATTRTGKAKASIGKAFSNVQSKVKDEYRTHTHKKSSTPDEIAAPTLKPHVASTIYTADLAAAVKHYQARHSLTDDGKLTPATIASLNVPLAARVTQLDDTLERWRWLPNDYVNAPLMVNLPEFVLRGFSGNTASDHNLDFTMKVVVGKVVGEHQTPVFAHMMKYLIFRPFWNVPISIIKKELTGHIDRSGVGYLAAHNFETVDSKGQHVEPSAAQIEHGGVIVREKPGPKNSLGLIKFMFPNEYDIYLHSTPQPELFSRSRRDFSHGCVRVQHPDELAVWVLRNNPGDWDLDKVQDAMNNGEDNKTVSLAKPIPIVIFYATANVDDEGAVHFFDDLYGYDKQLEDVLSKGRPYPTQNQKINPNAHGDTA